MAPRISWVMCSALLVVGVLVPAAQAQSPDLSMTAKAPTGPVGPSSTLDVTVTMSCQAIVTHQDPMAGAVVDLVVTIANGVTAGGNTRLLFTASDCGGGQLSASKTATFAITVPRTAPGLTPIPGTIKASSSGLPEQTLSFTITADYYSVSQAKLAQKLKACACKLVQFDVELRNFGNARTQYTFKTVNKPSKWTLGLPAPLLIDSPNAGQGNATAHAIFTVLMPTGGHEGSFTVAIQPSAADDPSKVGNPLTVTFQARNESLLSKATPAPALPLALAAIAVAVAARRRP